MKVDYLLESDDRIAAIKLMQDKKYAGIRDSLDRRDISVLVKILRNKDRKQAALTGVDIETVEKLHSLNLVDEKGSPTPTAKPFISWVRDNPSKEQEYADKRGDADDALRRGHLKRDNDWVNPMQKKARRIIKSLDKEGEEILRKWYNRFINDRTKNLSKSWPDASYYQVNYLKNLGILDSDGNLTDFGEFTLNYYTAFKADPDGLDRVSGDRRVGNYGQTRDARRRRMTKALRR